MPKRRLSSLMVSLVDGCCSGWYWIERVGRVCTVLERGVGITVLRMWWTGKMRLVDRGGEGWLI